MKKMTNVEFINYVASAIQTALYEKAEVEKSIENGSIQFEDGIWGGYSGYTEDDFSLTYFENDKTFWAENYDTVEIHIYNDDTIYVTGNKEYKNFTMDFKF